MNSIQTKHLPPPPPQHLPLPPQHLRSHPPPRAIRKRSRDCSHYPPLHGRLRLAPRRRLHYPRTLHFPPQWRGNRIQRLGFPPPLKRKHKTVPDKSLLHHCELSHTDLDNTPSLHLRYLLPSPSHIFPRTPLRRSRRLSLGAGMDPIPRAAG